MVALEDLLADISGISPEAPLIDAPLGTERNASLRHFEIAPAAKIASVRPFPEFSAICPAARHRSLGAHFVYKIFIILRVLGRLRPQSVGAHYSGIFSGSWCSSEGTRLQ